MTMNSKTTTMKCNSFHSINETNHRGIRNTAAMKYNPKERKTNYNKNKKEHNWFDLITTEQQERQQHAKKKSPKYKKPQQNAIIQKQAIRHKQAKVKQKQQKDKKKTQAKISVKSRQQVAQNKQPSYKNCNETISYVVNNR